MKSKNLANIQLYPSDNFKIAIDNLTRKAFELCIDGGEKLTAEITESRAKNIKSAITISNLEKLKIKFDEFHWAVFDACLSEIRAGNEYTTLAVLRRKLGGTANKKYLKDENSKKNSPVNLNLDTDIKNAIEELAMVRIVVDMEDTKKFYDSPTKSGIYKFNGYILPSESLEMSVNGQDATLYHFTSKSILFATSEMKDQVITCDNELFQPPVRMTRRTVAINHFLLRRILEMKGNAEISKTNKRVIPLRHTILTDTLYRACGLDNANKRTKQEARQTAEKFLNYFGEQKLIKGYSIETDRGGKARAINIEL